MRALLSVWDKTGLTDLAAGLHKLGVILIASGGTSTALREAGVEHVDVATVTSSPEMLDGRVKTLHPRIHGGILADRSNPVHVDELARYEIDPIDIVVSNLYPFESDPSIELIDIGGPTMVRAAAKNHAHVAILTSPDQYAGVLDELERTGALSDETRRDLACAAFSHVADYDAAIAAWFERTGDEVLPPTLRLTLDRRATTRYGENPHQVGARYALRGGSPWWDSVTQHGGSALSYLNFFDADAAWRLVHEIGDDAQGAPAVAIIKHANASGAAIGASLADAYRAALAADPLSAFGGVVAVAGEIDADLAAVIAEGPQADVIVASGFGDGATAILTGRRRATRLLSGPRPDPLGLSVRTFGATALVQDADELLADRASWRCVTQAQPTDDQWRDLALAWRVCARTTSNAIVLARGGVAVGVGAGQQSRVVAAQIATEKAGEAARGAAAASDAFFPFPDGLAALTSAGVTSVVQPGGSIKDDEIIAAADEAGIVMVLTGERHFRH